MEATQELVEVTERLGEKALSPAGGPTAAVGGGAGSWRLLRRAIDRQRQVARGLAAHRKGACVIAGNPENSRSIGPL